MVYTRPESRWRGASTRDAYRISSACLFCNSTDHKSLVCPKYMTIAERRSFLQENKMCLNCGRDGHFVKDCTREGCRNCQGRKHYHALCPLKERSKVFIRHDGYYARLPFKDNHPPLPTNKPIALKRLTVFY
ncbi:unnamed protein product [Heligmosomoides polygyrus]|uniref:CCHC-type domain-containing protein n=1 Tax=Heligmosomoides polygyrus TaxID=6339 RepID=A0A183FN60_HELPZ|nr:unnamed protein product [Heligmosomoides polygyrus]